MNTNTTLTTSSGRTLRLLDPVPAAAGQPAGWLVLVDGESAPEWRSTAELVGYLDEIDLAAETAAYPDIEDERLALAL
jgi:hypothetical protein